MSKPNGSAKKGFKWVHTTTLTTPAEKKRRGPMQGWSVQFALPPSPEHCDGGGACWFPKGAPRASPAEAKAPETAEIQTAAEAAGAGAAASAGNANGLANGDTVMVDAQPGPVANTGYIARRESALPEASGGWVDVYAAACMNKIRIYRANRGQKPTLLQVYEDSDEDEQYYSLTWMFNANRKNEWWVATAGLAGVVRVLNVTKCRLESTLIGHGKSVNHLATHPLDPALILTASMDESLRLWNLRTASTVAIFAGLKGHRNEVVCVDFHHSGHKFASCGIDNSIRAWDIVGDENVMAAIKESHLAADRGVTDVSVYYDENNMRRKTLVPMVQSPMFSFKEVHKHYVDCVGWIGDLLISKSLHNRLLMWDPEGDREALSTVRAGFSILEEYLIDHATIWFIRFGVDSTRQLVACGNERGVVSVFKLDDIPSRLYSQVWPGKTNSNRKQPTENCVVRQCAFNNDASILLAIDDNSRVAQYERF